MGTPLTTDDLRKIDQIEQMAAIQPTDMLVAQRPSAAAGRITAAQIAGYAADTYNVSGTCATAAASEYKDVTITGVVVPQTLAVTFTNANTFGDSTASTATYPKLRVYGTGQTLLTTLDICDSRGHTAGTGCWNAGDVILFRVIGIKALISNSDVRQYEFVSVQSPYRTYEYKITAAGEFSYAGTYEVTSTGHAVIVTDNIARVGDIVVNAEATTDGSESAIAKQMFVTQFPRVQTGGKVTFYLFTTTAQVASGKTFYINMGLRGRR